MRCFAIVPAAGLSQRMGCDKLLMPWGAETVIEHVLAAWKASGVEQTVVVVGPESHRLAELCRQQGALVVEAEAQPPDMKASVRLGLAAIESRFSPREDDAWLLAPADMPLLTAALVDQIISAWRSASPQQQKRIFAPEYQGRRGHPVLFPWLYAAQVFALPEQQGINALTGRKPGPVLVPAQERGAVADIDTPEDYQRWQSP